MENTKMKNTIDALRQPKKLFYFVVILLSLTLLISGFGTGFHCDEMDQNEYATAVMRYYGSGGKDTSYHHITLPDGMVISDIIQTYGALFDVPITAIANLFPDRYHYDVRHVFVQISGLAAMYFAALIVIEFTGSYVLALCVFLMVFLTPIFTGNALMNAKDIPFACFYSMAVLFCVRLLRQHQGLKWRPVLLAALGIGLAMSVRIAGIVFVPVVGVFLLINFFVFPAFKSDVLKNPKRYLLMGIAFLLIPYALLLLSCPFIQEKPIDHLFYCLDVARKFPQKIHVIFESQYVSSLNLPSHYLLKWMTLTIPLFVMLLMVSGLVNLLLRFLSFKKNTELFFVYVMVLLPVFMAISGSAYLYNRWRHLLFVYPAAVAVSVVWIIPYLKNKRFVQLTPWVVVLSMAHPLVWMIRFHPFEYIYFNEISGGFEKNYTRFETDGWQLSVRKATDWLAKQEVFKQSKDKVVGSNAASQVWYQLKKMEGFSDVKVNYSGYKGYNAAKWNFLILNVNFMPPEFLERNYPPSNASHVVEVEGKPMCVVVIDTVRNDRKSVDALFSGKYRLADSLANEALKLYPESERLLEIRCVAGINQGKALEIEGLIRHALEIYPDNPEFNYFNGVVQYHHQQFNEAIVSIRRALEVGLKPDALVFRRLSTLYNQIGNIPMAEEMELTARKFD